MSSPIQSALNALTAPATGPAGSLLANARSLSLQGTIQKAANQANLAMPPAKLPTPRTTGQARAAISTRLTEMGLGGGGAANLIRDQIFESLNLDGTHSRPVSRDTVKYTQFLDRLVSNRRSRSSKGLVVATFAARLPTRTGARQGMMALTGARGFWHRLNGAHLAQVTGHLEDAVTSRQVDKTVGTIKQILGNRFYAAASDQGRANALENLERTRKLLGFNPLMPRNYKEAWRGAERFAQNACPSVAKARDALTQRLMENYTELRERFFEPVSQADEVWVGEAYKTHLFGNDFFRMAYDLREKSAQASSRCNTNGSRSQCRVIQ